jgi:predicted deacylase
MESTEEDRPPFRIGSATIAPGARGSVELSVGRHHTGGELEMPVHVVHGKRRGPTLFVSAALHGDEINGTEIIRRVLRHKSMKRLRGTLIAVPVVNVFGFIAQSRYLPDRRDLNRSFPGSSRGSLAGRLANLFMKEVAAKADFGIDLHTGAVHRSNFPQVRVQTESADSMKLARAFAAPLILNAEYVQGSLRGESRTLGIPIVVYEAGEALRFEEWAIRPGFRGILDVMRAMGMLPRIKRKPDAKPRRKPLVATGSSWVRAPRGGILRSRVRLGAPVRSGEVLAEIGDPLGEEEYAVISTKDGIVVGILNLPLVNEGDALYHIARFDDDPEVVSQNLEDFLPPANPLRGFSL